MPTNDPPHRLVFPARFAGIDGPWQATLIFVPISLALFAGAWLQLGWTPVFAWGLGGLALWTLMEYLFHRFGHWVHRAGRARGWGLWTEGFHWVHHDSPEDPGHFTTRPLAVGLLAAIFFLIFLILLPDRAAALALEAGTLLGYLAYEWVHFRAHWSPAGNGLSRYWKRYHLHHHYSREETAFGVTTPLWDWLLRPFLRKASHGA